MKKYLALILALLMILAVCACGTENDVQSENTEGGDVGTVGVANPMQESTEADLKASTGFDLIAPEGAQDCSWFEIAGDPVLAHLRFTLDGKEYTLRAEKTDALDEAIAGMYCEWSITTDGSTESGDPTCFFVTEDNADAVFACYHNGATWCVSTSDGADMAVMQAIVLDCIAAQ